MKGHFFLVVLASGLGLGLASVADAQVFIRAPFVRVQVGGGVYVRAPFVNLWVPPPVYMVPPNAYVPPMPRVTESPPPPSGDPQAQSQQPPAQDGSPPQPAKAAQTPTLDQFAQSFQPKAGNYDVTIINPATNQPTQVRFSLPEGNPRRVHVRRNEIEFDYGIRRFVRIEFDRDGAMITSR